MKKYDIHVKKWWVRFGGALVDSNNKNPKIIVSLETKQSIDLAHKIVDYVDGFKINHLLWDEIVAWADEWARILGKNYSLISNSGIHQIQLRQ